MDTSVNLTPEYIGIVSALVLNSQKTAMEQANQYLIIRDNIRRMRNTAKNPILKLAISIYCGEDMDDEFIMTHPYEASASIIRAIRAFDLIQNSIFNNNGALNVFFGSLSIDNCYMTVSDIYANNMTTIACMDQLINMAATQYKDEACQDFLINLRNSFFRDINKLGECMALTGMTMEELGAKCGALVHQETLQGYTNYPDANMNHEEKKKAAEDSIIAVFSNLCTVTRYIQTAYQNAMMANLTAQANAKQNAQGSTDVNSEFGMIDSIMSEKNTEKN